MGIVVVALEIGWKLIQFRADETAAAIEKVRGKN